MTLDLAAAGLIVLLAIAWLVLRGRRKRRAARERAARMGEGISCGGGCEGCPALGAEDGSCPSAGKPRDEDS